MKYAYFDAEGRVSTAHNDGTVSVCPDGAVPLSALQWDRRFDLRLVDGAIIDAPLPSAASIDAVRQRTRNAIRAAFETEANANVTALGITWQGGFDSAIKLDAARRLAEAAGAESVEFFAADDVGHVLDFADALAVTIAVAAAYETAMAKKKAAFRAIAAATTPAELDAITWS